MTAPLPIDPAEIAAAVVVLRRGGLVAFPTETVYGLGADASSDRAVRRIYAVKGRPIGHPVIVHLADAATALDPAQGWCTDALPAAARALAEACWPGPLTVLVPRGPRVADVVTGGRPTVGLRVPDQPVAHALLSAFGGGIAAPSANHFGKVSPTTAAHVRSDLGAAVELVLDGGPCAVGLESTIVDCTVDPPVVLRHGGVTIERLRDVLGPMVAEPSGPSRAPGMLPSHYAPVCAIEVVASATIAAQRVGVLRAEGIAVDVLDPRCSADDWARHLYGWLRDADDRGLAVLVVVPPEPVGLGAAVVERIEKAAAPRPLGARSVP